MRKDRFGQVLPLKFLVVWPFESHSRGVMMIEEKISESVRKLPPSLQQELLDFVDFLLTKAERRETWQWNDFSITSAMRGTEDEEPLYTLDDVKVVFR